MIIAIDETLIEGGRYVKANIDENTKISRFFQHCCQMGHYSFDILKFGRDSCNICKPVRLPKDIFNSIKHLPFPLPDDHGHYQPFSTVLGKDTTEEHRPSLKGRASNAKVKSLPFYASVQHVKNAQLMVQCEECNMWRLVYSKYKLPVAERCQLQQLLNEHSYSCGAKLQDLHLEDKFKDVEIRDHACGDLIEKLHYSASFEPILMCLLRL